MTVKWLENGILKFTKCVSTVHDCCLPLSGVQKSLHIHSFSVLGTTWHYSALLFHAIRVLPSDIKTMIMWSSTEVINSYSAPLTWTESHIINHTITQTIKHNRLIHTVSICCLQYMKQTKLCASYGSSPRVLPIRHMELCVKSFTLCSYKRSQRGLLNWVFSSFTSATVHPEFYDPTKFPWSVPIHRSPSYLGQKAGEVLCCELAWIPFRFGGCEKTPGSMSWS